MSKVITVNNAQVGNKVIAVSLKEKTKAKASKENAMNEKQDHFESVGNALVRLLTKFGKSKSTLFDNQILFPYHAIECIPTPRYPDMLTVQRILDNVHPCTLKAHRAYLKKRHKVLSEGWRMTLSVQTKIINNVLINGRAAKVGFVRKTENQYAIYSATLPKIVIVSNWVSNHAKVVATCSAYPLMNVYANTEDECFALAVEEFWTRN